MVIIKESSSILSSVKQLFSYDIRTWTLTLLTMARLAPFCAKIKTTFLCPFFEANMTGVDWT